MDAVTEAARAVKSQPADVAAPALEVFELGDLLALILRLAAAPDALLVSKRVARNACAVAPAVRKLVWNDLILKGDAILKGHTSFVRCCAFSPDGERIVTASNDWTARLWDAESGALLLTLEGHTGIYSCAFSPDGKRVVTASFDKTARLWDAETGALLLTLKGHTAGVMSCAFSPNGKHIVTASFDKTARLLGLRDGRAADDARGAHRRRRELRVLARRQAHRDGELRPYGATLGRRDGRTAADARGAHRRRGAARSRPTASAS